MTTFFPLGTPVRQAYKPAPGTPDAARFEAERRAAEQLAAEVAAFNAIPPIDADALARHPGSLGRPIPRTAFPSALAIVAGTLAALIAPPADSAQPIARAKPSEKRADPAGTDPE